MYPMIILQPNKPNTYKIYPRHKIQHVLKKPLSIHNGLRICTGKLRHWRILVLGLWSHWLPIRKQLGVSGFIKPNSCPMEKLTSIKQDWWQRASVKTRVLTMKRPLCQSKKMTSLRTLLAPRASKSWHFHQMDVQNAFLYSVLDEEVYMTIPQV